MISRFFDKKLQKAWRRPGLLALFVAVGLSVGGSAAFAQSSSDLTNRLRRLENEMQTLSRAVYRGETPPAGAIADSPESQANTEVRLQQLETELRTMNGKIEEQNFQLRQLREQMDKMVVDMDLRLKDLEGGTRAAAQPITPPAPGAASTPPAAESYQWRSGGQLGSYGETTGGAADGAATAYEHAFTLLKGGQYDAAGQKFESFLKQNPDHALASNAQYWLGETYYARGEYSQAARVFAEGYQKFPNGQKAPDNLLKLGLALEAQGNKADACVALKQIETAFANGAGPVLRRAQQEIARIGC